MRTYSPAKKNLVDFWIIFGFIAVNIITKSLFLGNQSIWLDEASTISTALQPFSKIFEHSLNDPNGPIYQMLLKVWISIFGISEFSTRIIPMLAASITVWPLYLLNKNMFNRNVAILVVIFYSISNIAIYYAHENRPYTFVLLFTVISFHYYYKILTVGGNKNLLAYLISNILLFLFHLTSILILPAQFLATLTFLKNDTKKCLMIYAGMLISTVVISVWVLSNNWFGGGETYWVDVPSLVSFKVLFIHFLNSKLVLNAFIILILLYLTWRFIFKKNRQKEQREILTAFLWATVPVLIMFIISITYNSRFLPRYMIYSLPGLYVFMGSVIYYTFKQNWLKFSTSVLFIILMLIQVELNPTKDEFWRKAVSFVKQHKDESTLVTVCAHYQAMSFSYYYDEEIFKDINYRLRRLKNESVYTVCELDPLLELLRGKPEIQKLILVQSHTKLKDPEGKVLNYFLSNHSLVDAQSQLRGIQVFVFDLTKGANEAVTKHIQNVQIEKKEYNTIYIEPLARIKENQQIVSAHLKATIKSDVQLNNALLVINTRGANENSLWKGIHLTKVEPGTDFIIDEKVYLSSNLPEGTELAIYVWQPTDKNRFVVEDIQITMK